MSVLRDPRQTSACGGLLGTKPTQRRICLDVFQCLRHLLKMHPHSHPIFAPIPLSCFRSRQLNLTQPDANHQELSWRCYCLREVSLQHCRLREVSLQHCRKPTIFTPWTRNSQALCLWQDLHRIIKWAHCTIASYPITVLESMWDASRRCPAAISSLWRITDRILIPKQ